MPVVALFLAASYPFTKRFFAIPQAYLGIAFGFVLERSGFGRAQKLVAQFYLTDMAVFRVMFTAVVTAAVGSSLLAAVAAYSHALFAFALVAALNPTVFLIYWVALRLSIGAAGSATSSPAVNGRSVTPMTCGPAPRSARRAWSSAVRT